MDDRLDCTIYASLLSMNSRRPVSLLMWDLNPIDTVHIGSTVTRRIFMMLIMVELTNIIMLQKMVSVSKQGTMMFKKPFLTYVTR
jgi:hypothetical protein